MSAGLGQIETSLANVKNREGNKFVLVQDCFRHFDRESVGNDASDLSLFEMPAAFIVWQNSLIYFSLHSQPPNQYDRIDGRSFC